MDEFLVPLRLVKSEFCSSNFMTKREKLNPPADLLKKVLGKKLMPCYAKQMAFNHAVIVFGRFFDSMRGQKRVVPAE